MISVNATALSVTSHPAVTLTWRIGGVGRVREPLADVNVCVVMRRLAWRLLGKDVWRRTAWTFVSARSDEKRDDEAEVSPSVAALCEHVHACCSRAREGV